MSIKLAVNRFWVVSKLLNCAATIILLTRHHTTHSRLFFDKWKKYFKIDNNTQILENLETSLGANLFSDLSNICE
jgi:hypothetical protein